MFFTRLANSARYKILSRQNARPRCIHILIIKTNLTNQSHIKEFKYSISNGKQTKLAGDKLLNET